MKELDFLPDWYKDEKRRQSHVRRQYVALVAVFLLMMAFNVTATHRASTAAAEVAGLEGQRACSEAIVYEFDVLTKRLNELKTRANLVEQVNSRADFAAILAEVSHLVGDPIVLRKVDILAEPLGRTEEKGPTKGAAVRLAGKAANTGKEAPLGRVKFRIVLTGVAAHPSDVADLVCQLDASPYFQQVHPSFYGNARVPLGAKSAPGVQEGGSMAQPQDAVDLTEFEIACYLANYRETEE